MQSAQQFWTEAYVSSCRRPCMRSLFYPRRFLSQWEAITKLSQGCSQVSKQDEASLDRCNCLVLPHASYGPVRRYWYRNKVMLSMWCEELRTSENCGLAFALVGNCVTVSVTYSCTSAVKYKVTSPSNAISKEISKETFSFPPPRNSWQKEKTKLLCSIVQNLIVGQWRTQHLLLRYCEWSWKIRNLAIGRNIGETQRLPDYGSW